MILKEVKQRMRIIKKFSRRGFLIMSAFVLAALLLAGCTEPTYYQLTTSVVPTDGGTISPADGTYVAHTQVTLIATPAQYYNFDGWAGDASGTANPLTIKMDYNRTIVALFSTTSYNLTVNVPPGVGATVSPGSGVHHPGEVVTVTATATMCPYSFDGWSGTDNNSVNPTTVTMTADKSVTLYFINYTAGQPVHKTETIWGGGYTNIPIELNQFEWIQGSIWDPYFNAVLKDPNGTSVLTLGQNSSFSYNAEIPGTYILALHNTNQLSNAAYSLDYTIYHR